MRAGPAQWLSEVVATFGLVGTILGARASGQAHVPYVVGLYIAAAYWFTASTSFANPAVTVARSLTDTFPAYSQATSRRLSLPRSSARWELFCSSAGFLKPRLRVFPWVSKLSPVRNPRRYACATDAPPISADTHFCM